MYQKLREKLTNHDMSGYFGKIKICPENFFVHQEKFMICPEKFCILGKIMTCAENFLGETVSPEKSLRPGLKYL